MNSAGIGYHTAEELALHGAKVYIGARSEKRAHAAIERLYAEHPRLPRGLVVYLPLNLSDLNNVVEAAEAFLKQETRLDILREYSSQHYALNCTLAKAYSKV